MSIDTSNLPSHVQVRVGATVTVELPSYASSGNVWSIARSGDAGIATVGISVVPPRVEPPPEMERGRREPPTPTLGRELLLIAGMRKGFTQCEIVLARPFGERTVMSRHSLDISVSE